MMFLYGNRGGYEEVDGQGGMGEVRRMMMMMMMRRRRRRCGTVFRITTTPSSRNV